MIKLRPRHEDGLGHPDGANHILNDVAVIVGGSRAWLDGDPSGWRTPSTPHDQWNLDARGRWTGRIDPDGILEIDRRGNADLQYQEYEVALAHVLAYRLDAELIECSGHITMSHDGEGPAAIWLPPGAVMGSMIGTIPAEHGEAPLACPCGQPSVGLTLDDVAVCKSCGEGLEADDA